MPATRWTWLAGDAPGIVCRGFLAFVPAVDKYVCSVLAHARVTHHLGETADEATEAARTHVEGTYGAIRQDRPEVHMAQLRIGRWGGVPILLGGDQGIPLHEEWVQTVARGNSAQARGYFDRKLLPELPEKQQAILRDWVAKGNWDNVPVDAVFAAAYPDLDYITD